MSLPQLKELQGKELQKHYDEKSFWKTVAELVKKAAKELLEKALWLFYAAESPETPVAARYTAYGALGYLILPIDAVPDFFPGVGYVDDLAVITVALLFIAYRITPEVKKQATEKMNELFG